jgi:hypothetical protein
MMGLKVDGLRKHPFGRVDQLEDRYLGMVEATSSNLVTSTIIVSLSDANHHCVIPQQSIYIESLS